MVVEKNGALELPLGWPSPALTAQQSFGLESFQEHTAEKIIGTGSEVLGMKR